MLTFKPDSAVKLFHSVFGEISVSIEPLKGGASTRKYFRFHGRNQTAILMFVPDIFPEEIIIQNQASTEYSFIDVHRLLNQHKINVPEIFAYKKQDGLILLEDLGNNTLAEFLVEHPDQKTEIYQQAVFDLAMAQIKLQHLPSTAIVRQRFFDFKLLRWELDHFKEWALNARGFYLSKQEESLFDEIANRLCVRISKWPFGFVHRDYQSRNLMIRRNNNRYEIVWIDFQDALWGPHVYDLVALLNDSYQTFDDPFVKDRIHEFAQVQGCTPEGSDEIQRQFDWMTVQRKLKDAGRFVFIDRVKNNPYFLGFVETTIEKAKKSMRKRVDDPDMINLLHLFEDVGI